MGALEVTGRDHRIVSALWRAISDNQRSMAPRIVEGRFLERLNAILAENVEAPSERWARENAEALGIMEQLGNARAAAMIAARRICPDDPSAHYRLAQRFRGLRRARK